MASSRRRGYFSQTPTLRKPKTFARIECVLSRSASVRSILLFFVGFPNNLNICRRYSDSQECLHEKNECGCDGGIELLLWETSFKNPVRACRYRCEQGCDVWGDVPWSAKIYWEVLVSLWLELASGNFCGETCYFWAAGENREWVRIRIKGSEIVEVIYWEAC